MFRVGWQKVNQNKTERDGKMAVKNATKSAATAKVAKPRVSRKAAAKPTVTIVHGTRNPRVTRVSRVHVEQEHGVKLRKGITADAATAILLATGKFSGVESVTWSQAPAELRSLLSALDDEGDEGDE